MTLLAYLAPLVLALVALDLTRRPVGRAQIRLHLPEWAALLAMACALGAAVLLAIAGPLTLSLPGILALGFAARIDIVSVAMLLTVSFVGWIVLRFSRKALDGEAGQSGFMAMMSATLAAVLLLVSAGNLVQLVLAWAMVGLGLHRLILFYPDRPRAQRAARKKTVSGLMGTGALLLAAVLLIRFADVLLAAPGVLALLALIGGFSALVGAAVALTQPSVKTALAWSTCAQMGFMVLQIGLALFPLALLHIVAHSLYKAHAFLASGGAVEQVGRIRRPGPVAIPDLRAVGRAFGLALAIYAVVGLMFGIMDKPVQTVALGAILIFGVAYLIAQGLADLAPWPLTIRTVAMSGAATLAYFGLQAGITALSAGTLPAPPAADGLIWATLVLAVGSFGLASVAQATFPLWAGHPAAMGLRVHLMNGLYLNALTDRMIGQWRASKG